MVQNLLAYREGLEPENLLTLVLILAAVTVAALVLGPTLGQVFGSITPSL